MEFDRSNYEDRSGTIGDDNDDINNSMAKSSDHQMFPPRSKSPTRQAFLKRNKMRKPLLLHKMSRR